MTTSEISPSGVRVSLHNVDLWQKFYPKNEMVVTKPGKKLFPNLEVTIQGLNPEVLYTVHFYLERVNNIRYHFNKNTGKWEAIGPVQGTPAIVKKAHNRGGLKGSEWMKNPVSFFQFFITNGAEIAQKPENNDHILVTSMHKYQPIIAVRRVCDGYEEDFRLTMTEFMVVTVYKDPEIRDLNKKYNKYANGFRLEGKHMTRSQDDTTPRRGKRAIPSDPSAPFAGIPATKMVPLPAWSQNYLQIPQTPTTPSGPPPTFQNNQFMTPPTFAMTPSTMITPPSMGATPPTPSSSGSSSQNIQNPMWPVTPPVFDYNMHPDWSQFGAWNVPQMAGGAPQVYMNQGVPNFQNFQQFENPGNVPQNNFDFPPYDQAGTSSQDTDYDLRFL